MKISIKENAIHSTEYIPYKYYKSDIPFAFPQVELHYHNEIELNYVINGTGKFICNDETIISKKGDIIIIPQRIPHAVFPIESNHHRYDTLIFNQNLLGIQGDERSAKDYMAHRLKNFKYVYITENLCCYNSVHSLVENIFYCAKGNSPKLDYLLKIDISKLFWLLDDSGLIVESNIEDLNKNDVILESLDFINEHYTQVITISQISKNVNLSESYFMKVFKSAVGISAIEYINRLRIKKACKLLSLSKQKIIQIAFTCGFSNVSNFNRHFKRIMGCTPKEYRNNSK